MKALFLVFLLLVHLVSGQSVSPSLLASPSTFSPSISPSPSIKAQDPTPSAILSASPFSPSVSTSSTPTPSALSQEEQTPAPSPNESQSVHSSPSYSATPHATSSNSPPASPSISSSSPPPMQSSSQSASPSPHVLPSPSSSSSVDVSHSPTTSPTPSPSPQSQDQVSTVPFRDVSRIFGYQPITESFGGATVADLDSDGRYDFILTYHHGKPMRIYHQSPDGKFVRSPFSLKADIHGVCVSPRTADSSEKLIAVSVGGGRGTNPRAPNIFLTKPDRSIEVGTYKYGFGEGRSRGRVPVFGSWSRKTRFERRKNRGGPDVLFVNLIGNSGSLVHFAYENLQGNYSFRSVPGFQNVNEERAIVTDVDGDGQMELVHFSILRIFKLSAPFTFEDVTTKVWPGHRPLKRSISAVVELDFNNDGKMDLYIARARSSIVTPRGPPSVPEHGDVLLMNTGGTYVEVSAKAGIPQDTDSMAASAEDFDNNGYVDIIISTFDGPDIILLNQGDGTFKRLNLSTTKPDNTRGANIMAVDYDQDGRVDYIAGHGLRKQFFGNFKLMKNEMPLKSNTRYLHVRVGNEPSGSCTSLNAIVTVFLGNGDKMVRRVGGRGAQAGGQSYIDTVHFGMKSAKRARRVTVRWSTGVFQGKSFINSNQIVTFGSFP